MPAIRKSPPRVRYSDAVRHSSAPPRGAALTVAQSKTKPSAANRAAGPADRPAHGGAGPKVLEKALRVLDLFSSERPAWSIPEIASELQLPMATAHRIIRALVARDYLMRADSRYRLGFAAIDLGQRALDSIDLRWQLRSVLRRLASEVEETALLVVPDESRSAALCIDRIETTQNLRLSLEIGRLTPLHAGASAKALLAYSSEHLRQDVLSRPLRQVGPATITDAGRLERELEDIRKRGWAFSYEENNAAAWGEAAPILTRGRVIASIGFAAPTARYSKKAERQIAKLVVKAARDSEALLGT
jgi:IclR family acetate operon transcriptional repressor